MNITITKTTHPGTSLYIRPFLYGTDPKIGRVSCRERV